MINKGITFDICPELAIVFFKVIENNMDSLIDNLKTLIGLTKTGEKEIRDMVSEINYKLMITVFPENQ